MLHAHLLSYFFSTAYSKVDRQLLTSHHPIPSVWRYPFKEKCTYVFYMIAVRHAIMPCVAEP